MNESERNELRAIRDDIAKKDEEIKDVLLQLQKSLKRSQKTGVFQFLYGLGLTCMVVGITLTGHLDCTQGLIVFFVGAVGCLIISFHLFTVPKIKNKLRN